jgi:hypothetical protein
MVDNTALKILENCGPKVVQCYLLCYVLSVNLCIHIWCAYYVCRQNSDNKNFAVAQTSLVKLPHTKYRSVLTNCIMPRLEHSNVKEWCQLVRHPI